MQTSSIRNSDALIALKASLAKAGKGYHKPANQGGGHKGSTLLTTATHELGKAACQLKFVLTKANPYHKPAGSPEGGEFAEAPGGGGGGGGGTGSSRGWPHALSRAQLLNLDDLKVATNTFNNLENLPADRLDDDAVRELKEAYDRVKSLQAQKEFLEANRQAKLKELGDITRPANQLLNPSFKPSQQQLDEQRRKTESERIAAAAQQNRRSFNPLTPPEDITDVVGLGAKGPFGSLYDTSTRVATVTGRVVQSAQALNSIAMSARGITSTNDYSLMGAHLNNINNNVAILSRHINALPRESQAAYKSVLISAKRMAAAATRMARAIKRKVVRKKLAALIEKVGNPYHDARGRFTTGSGAGAGSNSPDSKQHYILERELQDGSRKTVSSSISPKAAIKLINNSKLAGAFDYVLTHPKNKNESYYYENTWHSMMKQNAH